MLCETKTGDVCMVMAFGWCLGVSIYPIRSNMLVLVFLMVFNAYFAT